MIVDKKKLIHTLRRVLDIYYAGPAEIMALEPEARNPFPYFELVTLLAELEDKDTREVEEDSEKRLKGTPIEEPTVVTFTCPECGEHVIEQWNLSSVTSERVNRINENGVLDYDFPIIQECVKWQYECASCGYILKNKGQNVIKDSDVVEWCKKNCPQD